MEADREVGLIFFPFARERWKAHFLQLFNYNFCILKFEVDTMKRLCVVWFGIMLVTALGYGQSSSAAPAQDASKATGHGSIFVKLSKTLDSSKLKEGDAIEVETTGGFRLPDGTLVPKGSKLSGHVVAAKARSKGDSDSQLTLAFDKLNAANGKQLSVKGGVQAVFPPAEEPMGPNMATAGTSQGGSGAGSSPTAAGVGLTNTKSGSNASAEGQAQSTMTPQSVGVQGIDNLQLDNGVISSKGKNVKLNGGVRLVVRADFLG